MAAEVWTIVVAAGSGQRYGAAKQFEPLAGARVVDVSVAHAARSSDGVVVVVPPGSGVEIPGADRVCDGGATRAESVRRGLAEVPDTARVVLVHDAARPVASSAVYRRVIDAVVAGADGVVPVVGVIDSMRGVDGQPVDRDSLEIVQTPQGFDADVLRAAHASGGEATDDATLVQRDGGRITTVAGDRSNLKITEPSDLVLAAALLEKPTMEFRVGNGFDIHRFSAPEDAGDRPLVLGGVVFEGATPLVGHSDADVPAHVVAEALLGAAGLGDLGSHFPDTDERWSGADSLELLAEVARLVDADGWTISNVDASVICERPKLAPHRDEMQRNLSEVVGAPVTIKGRRAEGIGGLGRGEGIAAMATAMLVRSVSPDRRTAGEPE